MSDNDFAGAQAGGASPEGAPEGARLRGFGVGGGRPRVLVAGAFGQGNPGDESVLAAFVAGLDGCDLTATTQDPAATVASHGCEAVDTGDTLAVARGAVRADLVVMTATVFKTLHPASGRPRHALLGNTLAMAAATRALGRSTVFAGVGAGMLDGTAARLLARAVSAVAGDIELRDEESARALGAAGVSRPLSVAADVTWAALPPPPVGVAPPPGRVLVTLSHLAGDDRFVEQLAGAVRQLTDAGVEVALQPWQPEQDGPLAVAIAARGHLRRVTIWEPPADVAAAAAAMGSEGITAVLALRFHSLVAAATAGVPFVAVAHEPKLAGLTRRLGQVAVSPAATAQEMTEACLRQLSCPPPPAAAVAAEHEAATAMLARVRQAAFRAHARRLNRARVIRQLVDITRRAGAPAAAGR